MGTESEALYEMRKDVAIMTTFEEYLLEQVRGKDRVIAELRYELSVRRAAMGDLDPGEFGVIPVPEKVQ